MVTRSKTVHFHMSHVNFTLVPPSWVILFRLDYYQMKINSTNSNRTIVAANIGVPDDDLKNSFLKRFVLSQGKGLFLLSEWVILYDSYYMTYIIWARITIEKKNFHRRESWLDQKLKWVVLPRHQFYSFSWYNVLFLLLLQVYTDIG